MEHFRRERSRLHVSPIPLPPIQRRDVCPSQGSAKGVRGWSGSGRTLHRRGGIPGHCRTTATPEFERWEYLDLYDLRQPISVGVERMLTREAARIGAGSIEATHGALKKIRNYLRPDFDAAIARATTIRRSEERLIRLTDEQYDVLDILEANRQSLVTGAAGTGKTMLALEHARRRALAGNSVLLLCFNRLLGDWLASTVSGVRESMREVRCATSEAPSQDPPSPPSSRPRKRRRGAITASRTSSMKSTPSTGS